jgi:hypothetical protein
MDLDRLPVHIKNCQCQYLSFELWSDKFLEFYLNIVLYSDGRSSLSYRERRREAHTAAEQKRRDAIKKECEWSTSFYVIGSVESVCLHRYITKNSVADPGCLSRIRIRPVFGIPDPDPTVFYPRSGSYK